MIHFPLKRAGGLGSLLALLFLSCYGIYAQERVFADRNCAITPPAGWRWMTNLPPQPVFCAAFGNTARNRLVMLMINDKGQAPGPMNERFVAEFERGVEASGGGKRVSGKFIEIAGLKAYERLGRAQVKGKEVSTLMQVVPANGTVYSVQAMRFDGDANDDPEIREALGSFRFIQTPSPPALSVSAAYKFGYFIGRLAPTVLLGGVIVAVVVAALRRKGSRRPQVPPPVPPHVRQ